MVIQILVTIGIISALFAVYKIYKEDEEQLLPLKVIGYYLLGGFKFTFNAFPIPLGYFIYLLFFKPNLNKKLKKYAAIIGLLAFFMGIIVPYGNKLYFERTRKIPLSSNNAYEVDYTGDYNAIKEKLGIEGTSKLQDFQVEFERDGKLKSLRYLIIGRDEKGLILYHVRVFPDKDEYNIKPNRADQWLQYNRLVYSDYFFDIVKDLDFKNMIPKKEYTWYSVESPGEWGNQGNSNYDNYLLTGEGIKELKDEEIPIEGYSFWVFGWEKMSESSSTGSGYKFYIYK